MSKKVFYISVNSYETRFAITEDGKLANIFIEHNNRKSTVGNIYKGKVMKAIAGMQSAFIDIGLARAGFLNVADIHLPSTNIKDCCIEEIDSNIIPTDEDIKNRIENNNITIEKILHEEDEITVQVEKDAYASKGARLTTKLSIAGKYLVLLINVPRFAVSKKISDSAERLRLYNIIKSLAKEGDGLIARTLSENILSEELEKDYEYLLSIKKLALSDNNSPAPSIIYEDKLLYKLLRDHLREDTAEIIIDNKNELEAISQLTYFSLSKEDAPKITLYDNKVPLFEKFKLENEIDKLLEKKVRLPSGGNIVIEETEALTVIDVNTSRYIGEDSFDETTFQTNLEAAKEIALQLRLRNIAGIIIVDFIDMADAKKQEELLAHLKTHLLEDKTKSTIENITTLGLVEITRKRTRQSIKHIIAETCPYCEGAGVIKAKSTTVNDIMRQLEKVTFFSKNSKVTLEAHPTIIAILEKEEDFLNILKNDNKVEIILNANDSLKLTKHKLTIE